MISPKSHSLEVVELSFDPKSDSKDLFFFLLISTGTYHCSFCLCGRELSLGSPGAQHPRPHSYLLACMSLPGMRTFVRGDSRPPHR
jgi:hypothetical protein